jgi:hypothetical protein
VLCAEGRFHLFLGGWCENLSLASLGTMRGISRPLHCAFTNARNCWCPLVGTTSTKQLKADILERVNFAYRSNRFTVHVAPVAQLTTLVVAILQNCPNSSLRILLEPHSYVRPSLYRKDRWIHPVFFLGAAQLTCIQVRRLLPEKSDRDDRYCWSVTR